jgi:hypothetical protein
VVTGVGEVLPHPAQVSVAATPKANPNARSAVIMMVPPLLISCRYPL